MPKARRASPRAAKASRGAKASSLDAVAAELARRALANIAREYPNLPHHVLVADADAVPPRELHPTFFGCFDWHSAVHTHWLLVRLLNKAPQAVPQREIVAALAAAFEPAKLEREADYLRKQPAFERPYGLAWLTLLAAEVATMRGSAAFDWTRALAPAAAAARDNVLRWLAQLRYPVRSGTHNQTAFALTLLFDAARDLDDVVLLDAVRDAALKHYSNDTSAPVHLEPSGEDFLSPALMEADLMRRVLEAGAFTAWLSGFLPTVPQAADAQWLTPAEVLDETDGKLVHLHGLNLSRAWNLENLADGLPAGDGRAGALRAAAERHREAGVRATLATRHYAGDHWLPTFATYLLTARGAARRAR
jgi:DUF2891 family protein